MNQIKLLFEGWCLIISGTCIREMWHIMNMTLQSISVETVADFLKENSMEDAGIDPATSRMLSERSTIWANPPDGSSHVLGSGLIRHFKQRLKICCDAYVWIKSEIPAF